MNNAEFQQRLEEMHNKFPTIFTKARNNTLNELVYVLRMDEEYDYNLSIFNPILNQWLCVPSVRECFIPVRTLARHVKVVKIDDDDDDDFECPEIFLTIVVED